MILSSHTDLGGAKGPRGLSPTFKRHLHNWLLLPDDPGHSVVLAVHRSHGITYDPVFTIGDRVHCRMGVFLLIFLTASIKLWFITCFQTPSLFGPQGRNQRWEKAKLKMSRQDQFKKSEQLSIMESDENYL